MAYILRADHGLDLPRSLQVEFSKIAQERMDADGKELTSPELWALFRQAYLLDNPPMTLLKQQTVPTSPDNRELVATLRKADGSTMTVEGEGNGPIDAFVDALKKAFKVEFSFIDYHEHAVGRGANATAASYVEIQDAEGRAGARRGHGPQHRDGLAQGHARRGLEADAARGQGGLVSQAVIASRKAKQSTERRATPRLSGSLRRCAPRNDESAVYAVASTSFGRRPIVSTRPAAITQATPAT